MAKAACTFVSSLPRAKFGSELALSHSDLDSKHWAIRALRFGLPLWVWPCSANFRNMSQVNNTHWASILKFWPWRAICVSLDLQWFIVWNSPLRTDSSWYLHIASLSCLILCLLNRHLGTMLYYAHEMQRLSKRFQKWSAKSAWIKCILLLPCVHWVAGLNICRHRRTSK